jgi:hypothetical protein
VNDDTGSAYQSFARIDVDLNGNFIIVWQDQRNGNNRLYFQRYNSFGTKNGYNINMDISPDISARSPRIKYKEDGSFIILWYGADGVNPGSFKFKFFNPEGIPITSAIIVNDTLPIFADSDPAVVGIDDSNNFYIVMSYTPGTDFRKLYIQKFDSLGNKIGSNQLISDLGVFSAQEAPTLNKKIYNRFIVSWRDTRLYTPNIFMQLYDSGGKKIGMNKKVTDDNIPNSPRNRPSVSSDSSGRFVLSWTDSRLTFGDYDNIFAQIYDPDGNEIGNNFRVDLGPSNAWNRRLSKVATRKDGHSVIAWYDQIGGPTMRKISPEGSFIGGEYFISYQGTQLSKILNDVAIWEDRIITVWQDNRNGDYDIYCNIRSYQNPDSIISNINAILGDFPSDYMLYQNYPNPFNPETRIKFSIPTFQNVTLKIFDITGKTIVTLLDEFRSAGTYEEVFDAAGLSSGIYFYTFYTDNYNHSKRMILVK